MAAVGRLQRTGNPPVQVVSSQRVSHGSGVSPGMSLSLAGVPGGGPAMGYGGESPSPAPTPTSPHHFHHNHQTPPPHVPHGPHGTHPSAPHHMYSSVPSPHGFHGYTNGTHHYHPDLPGFSRGGVPPQPNYMRYTPSPSPSQQVSACHHCYIALATIGITFPKIVYRI